MEDLRFKSPEDFFKKVGDDKPAGYPSKDLTFAGPTGKTPTIKTIDFFMGGQRNGSFITNRDNWRTVNRKDIGISFAENPVNKNVLLIPEDMNLSINGGMQLEDAKEQLGSSNSFLDFLTKANKIINGTVYVGAWQAKTFQDVKALTVGPTDFEFKFNFGNAGLYNSFEEVVKPIVALMLFFGIDSKGSISSSTASIEPPYPTKAQYFANQVKGILSVGVDTIKNGISADSATGLLDRVNAKVQAALNSAARSTALSSAYNNLYFTWGRFVIGPLVYENYSYSFDMSNLDEWGWPTSGKFKLSNLSSMRKSTTQAMLSPFVQGM